MDLSLSKNDQFYSCGNTNIEKGSSGVINQQPNTGISAVVNAGALQRLLQSAVYVNINMLLINGF